MAIQDWARVVGTVGAGTMSGLMLSGPLWAFPAMFDVETLEAGDRLRLWSKLFDHGKATAVLLLPLSSFSFLLSSFFTIPPPSYLSFNLIARNRRSVLLLAAGLLLANMPYTGVLLQPINKKLQSAEREVVESTEGKTLTDTDTLIKQWLKLHKGRFALSFTAFVLGVAELVSSPGA
ncbi:hypothetical protein MNV49_000354 [Pseudohyphozyma bogoriensis]|nr:hypothetical protein MNV49_000354 [Pseudohyphozyma bogoriensis]